MRTIFDTVMGAFIALFIVVAVAGCLYLMTVGLITNEPQFYGLGMLCFVALGTVVLERHT